MMSATGQRARPHPGPEASLTDTDGDGMPDEWETQYGLNPNNPSDAGEDADSDWATNLEEYWAGTDPTDPASVLRLAVGSIAPLVLEFVAEPNRGYTVEFQNVLGSGWDLAGPADGGSGRNTPGGPGARPGPRPQPVLSRANPLTRISLVRNLR